MASRTAYGSVLACVLLLTGCGATAEPAEGGPPPSTLRPPSAPATSSSPSEKALTRPPERRTSKPRTYSIKRITANPCLLLDDQDRAALAVQFPGAWGKSDSGTRNCLWVASGGYGVGAFTDKAVGPPTVLGGRPTRVRGHRAAQFRRENGGVCYTIVAIEPKRWIVLIADADSAPENRPQLCRVGKKFAARMVTHVS